ncbi:MAG: AAA family ATPase [Pelagibacterales bacterium]|nr:AAA family ATPase [Pelagibacterales bacterium]
MKLNKIEINNFKSIEQLEISIEKISVLIGENNSGKSNILKAIELFYEESVRNIDEEYFYFKNRDLPIQIIMTFNNITAEEKKQKYIKHWIYEDTIKIKKEVLWDSETDRYSMTLFGWQAVPKEIHFNLSIFESYKSEIKNIVTEKELPEYFKTEKGTITQASYKEGVKKHIENGLVQFGDPDWIKNPGGLKENFASLLPRFYLVPAVKDAQDESKINQQTVLGKLITDLTNRIVSKNPQFENVKSQIEGLKKYLNRQDNGDDSDRLQEIKDLETDLSDIISESMPDSKVQIEIITPELIDLFKDTKITIDDSLPTSIDSKGHGLQRALIFAYIRAYAKTLNKIENEEAISFKNFILGIEEPELFLHPNGQRKMMNVLTNIAANDQVVLCTHSNFFVQMHDYKNIVIVKRDNNGPTSTFQYTGDIFESDDPESRKRLKKVFRYLNLFDLSRSELFFAKKVILVEGDTEKFIIPFWASKFAEIDKKYDLSANNICVIECGGKTNLHVFMRVLNRFNIDYVVIYDVDPIDFPKEKDELTDNEKKKLRFYKENIFIENTLDEKNGRILKINPELENIIGVSTNQAEKEGKVGAAFFKYEDMDLNDYPKEVSKIIKLIYNWDEDEKIFEIKK